MLSNNENFALTTCSPYVFFAWRKCSLGLFSYDFFKNNIDTWRAALCLDEKCVNFWNYDQTFSGWPLCQTRSALRQNWGASNGHVHIRQVDYLHYSYELLIFLASFETGIELSVFQTSTHKIQPHKNRGRFWEMARKCKWNANREERKVNRWTIRMRKYTESSRRLESRQVWRRFIFFKAEFLNCEYIFTKEE